MRRPLAALVTLTQLHPLIAVTLCLGLGIGAPGQEQDCSTEERHAAGQHLAGVTAFAVHPTIDDRTEGTGPEGCPVAASCAPAPVAPYPSTVHPSATAPDGVRIALPANVAASLSQFPPPTPPPNN